MFPDARRASALLAGVLCALLLFPAHALEARLSEILGLDVSVDHKGEKDGVLKIRYATLEQLENLSHRLAQSGRN